MKVKFFIFFLFPFLLSAQNIDSLKTILKTAKQDTTRVNTLSELSQVLASIKPDTALIIGNEALSLAQKLNYKKGEAWAEFRVGRTFYASQNFKEALAHYNKALEQSELLFSSINPSDIYSSKKLKGKAFSNIGAIYKDQADYHKAMEYYLSALKISEEIKDKRQVGATLGNLAGLFHLQADYPNALENYFKGLKIAEALSDKQTVGRTLGNIASVYQEQADYPKALNYYLKALKLAEEAGNKRGVSLILGNIAIVYLTQSDFTNGLDYYFKGLKIAEEVGDKLQVGRTLINIAYVYINQSDYHRALEYYLKALKITEEIGDKQAVCSILGNIGNLYTIHKKYKDAEPYLKKAISISTAIGAVNLEKNHNKFLFTLYEKTNRPALALEHYKRYIVLNDSIYSQENAKKSMRSEMNFQYEKQQAVADAKHRSEMEKQTVLAQEKNRRQNLIIGSVVVGLVLVLVFAVFVFRSLRITRKQKELIALKNAETEKQKIIIEEKQKEIIDSIKYASRIQNALITSEAYISRKLNELK